MVKVELMNKEDIENVANFISELNNIEKSHIGFCGKDSQEIAHSLKEDITDIKYNNSFVIVYEEDNIIGVLGFDADLEDNSAEIWGPFVKETKWDVVGSMWTKMLELLPDEINSLSMFPNKRNSLVLQLANQLAFNRRSGQTILTFTRDSTHELQDDTIVELSQEYFSAMKQLHDKAFPDTYYNGQQILEQINEEKKVFVKTDNGDLIGYIYVEAEPAFGEGSIEYFAVKESARGKGIGGELLTVALKWFFTFETIDVITLCVNSNNVNAISLYKKVGFQHNHDLILFTKQIG